MTTLQKKEYATSTLKRIDEWTTNCDLKTSILMAFTTVIITAVFASEHILKSLEEIFKAVFVYWKTGIGHFDLLNLIIIILLIGAYWHFIGGLKSLYRVLKAKTKTTDITTQNGLITESVLFFKSIKGLDYTHYVSKINTMTAADLEADILSQIYVCSVRCEEKFESYNEAIKKIMIGFVFLLSFVVLIVINNSRL